MALVFPELGHEFPSITMLDADLHTSSKAVYFKQAFPEPFVQCGIAEQNMFGIAAGLATQGFIPFPCTFAVFTAKRALDQVSISITYPWLNVELPSHYVGIPTSRAGASHLWPHMPKVCPARRSRISTLSCAMPRTWPGLSAGSLPERVGCWRSPGHSRGSSCAIDRP